MELSLEQLNHTKASPSEAHPDTMDFLSREWCNFAVQSLHNSIDKFQSPVTCTKMDDSDFKPSIPPWNTNDVKSWIRMQQAMHPELNYNAFFRNKFKLPWKITPSIKQWWKEIKAKRKEERRLQRAEVHAAVSVAGLAAALAAVAAENARNSVSETKESAVASAAAVVAAQCAEVAEAMGASREQLSSAMIGTTVSDILTLTASATTSLRGAATLKARRGCKTKRLNVTAPVLPIQESSDFDQTDISLLAKGTHLFVQTPDGDFKVRTVSIVLNSEGKVILVLKKQNLLKRKTESVVMNVHVELYKDPESDQVEDTTCYLIVVRTNKGTIKLDMGDDHSRYKRWVTTINHMLTLSNSTLTKYELQFCKK